MPEPVKEPAPRTETIVRTLLVAFFVSLVCSSLVASAAILLKPRQAANMLLDVRRNILEVAGLLEPGRDLNQLYESIEPRVIDLETGAYVEDVDPESFDPIEAAKDPTRSVAVPLLVGAGRSLPEAVALSLGAGLMQTSYGTYTLRAHVRWGRAWALAMMQWCFVPIGVAVMMGGGPSVVYGGQAFEALEQFEAIGTPA